MGFKHVRRLHDYAPAHTSDEIRKFVITYILNVHGQNKQFFLNTLRIVC